jgi:hypothetical protein
MISFIRPYQSRNNTYRRDKRLQPTLASPHSAIHPPCLRYYDGLTHEGLFSLSKHLRQAIAEEKTVITVDKPFYIYSPEE